MKKGEFEDKEITPVLKKGEFEYKEIEFEGGVSYVKKVKIGRMEVEEI